jgi:hypothetical protein
MHFCGAEARAAKFSLQLPELHQNVQICELCNILYIHYRKGIRAGAGAALLFLFGLVFFLNSGYVRELCQFTMKTIGILLVP